MNKQLEELATLYVLDQLDPGERAAFEARLVNDPELASLVGELEPVLAGGIRDLPRHEPPAGTFDRIEARIDALRDRVAAAGKAAPAFNWPSLTRWGVAAVIAVSLATLAVQSLRPAAAGPVIVFVELDRDRSTFAEIPLRETGGDPDSRFMALATLAGNYWKKPGELPVNTGTAPGDNRGYALFDPGSRQGFIGIEQLPVAEGNQRYHLWIVDTATGRIHDAGILPMDGMSRGLYSFALGPDDSPPSARPNFFITVEGEGSDTTQPRGRVVLGQKTI